MRSFRTCTCCCSRSRSRSRSRSTRMASRRDHSPSVTRAGGTHIRPTRCRRWKAFPMKCSDLEELDASGDLPPRPVREARRHPIRTRRWSGSWQMLHLRGLMELPTTQLLVFRFGSGASYEGGLLGALERIETGMALRVLDMLFVRRAETGELEVLTASGNSAGGLAGTVLEF